MTTNIHGIGHRIAIAPRRGGRSVLATLALMLAHGRERAALSRLDADALADLGIAPSDAAREAARPIWDLAPGRC